MGTWAGRAWEPSLPCAWKCLTPFLSPSSAEPGRPRPGKGLRCPISSSPLSRWLYTYEWWDASGFVGNTLDIFLTVTNILKCIDHHFLAFQYEVVKGCTFFHLYVSQWMIYGTRSPTARDPWWNGPLCSPASFSSFTKGWRRP